VLTWIFQFGKVSPNLAINLDTSATEEVNFQGSKLILRKGGARMFIMTETFKLSTPVADQLPYRSAPVDRP
jgi:hypothetical protein